jgi:hypothetical protein
MEPLTKKTTILFTPDLHRRLMRVAEQRHTSLGDLVRSACEQQYGIVSTEDRMRAAERLVALGLPVGSPRSMKRESVPRPRDLVP